MSRKPSIDGFVPRRSTDNIGEHHIGFERDKNSHVTNGLRKVDASDKAAMISTLKPSNEGLKRSDIDESLSSIDNESEENSQKTGFLRRKNSKKDHKKRLWIKRSLIAIGVVVLLLGAWMVVKFIIASGNVFNGDIFGLIQQRELKMDENGRTNILLFGTSEDDNDHDAPYLTDSMMVVSIDQKAKNAYMVSIPRDLYVEYGSTCFEGSRGKINAYYKCLGDDFTSKEAEQKKLGQMQDFIGDIVGLKLQYSVHVNYSVVRDLVNAVDGITVNIEGTNGAPGVMDSNFDWKCRGGNAYASKATMVKNCPPNGHFIDYPNGPAKLDGEHALYLAQARGANGYAYGLDGSNFAREMNQQKIIVALKDKALSTGTLTNLSRVTELMSALGDNLRTNFETAEIRTLLSLGDIASDNIKSIDLYSSENPVVKNASIDGQSSVIPVAGMYDYSGIRELIRKTINATPVEREAAKVVVLNGSGVVGVALAQANKLEELGMVISSTDNAPTSDYNKTVVYKASNKDKPKTAEKLKSLYSVSEISTENLPISAAEDVDFMIIIGANTANSTE